MKHWKSHANRRSFLRQNMVAAMTGMSLWNRNTSTFAAESVKRLVDTDVIQAAKSAPLAMLFRGSTVDDATKWRQKFNDKLTDLLGDFKPPEKWSVVEESRQEFGDHSRLELLLTADGVPAVPVYLLIPKGVSKNAPGVLCVHGHGKYGHHPIAGRTDIEGVANAISRANYDYGLQFVRRGYVVAAPCLIPFGDRLDRNKYGATDACATTFVRMQALGQLLIAANLRDLRWCLNLLQKRPEVNAERIGCAGLSYGGRMTMLVSAMDRRIKVAAPSGAFNLLQERITKRYSCGAQIIPGLLKYGDFSEIGSLIAPRPCVWEIGSKDSLITPEWAALFRRRLERIYKAFGVPENLSFDNFEGGHRWNGKIAFPLFDRVLKA